MSEFWGYFEIPPYSVHHGVLVEGDRSADYYTSQPDPDHWIAVGLVSAPGAGRRGPRRMLVGQACTEDRAIQALWGRIAELSGDSPCITCSESRAVRDDEVRSSTETYGRIYLAGGDRLTVPNTVFVCDDPTDSSFVCVDAGGSCLQRFDKADVIGYLIVRRHPNECQNGPARSVTRVSFDIGSY